MLEESKNISWWLKLAAELIRVIVAALSGAAGASYL